MVKVKVSTRTRLATRLFVWQQVLERIIWPLPAHGVPKKTASKKWLKNLLRSAVVAFTVLVALVRRFVGADT